MRFGCTIIFSASTIDVCLTMERAMKTISIIKIQKITLTRTLAAYYECCMSSQ
jgi:hypothetical protein